MIPPIAQLCRASPTVLAALGSDPMRVYPLGLVENPGAKPYSLWQVISGAPENYLDRRPNIDAITTQHDVYAGTEELLMPAVRALRDAFEGRGHITRWGGLERDPETKMLRFSFDVDWLLPR